MKKNNGFTLLELLVVIGIIGILMAVGVVNYTKAQQKARDSIRKTELKQLQNALELYKNDQAVQAFPATWASLVPNYVKATPKDPREKGTAGSWSDYTYTPGAGLTYTLTACLENINDPDGGAACSAGRGVLYTLTQP